MSDTPTPETVEFNLGQLIGELKRLGASSTEFVAAIVIENLYAENQSQAERIAKLEAQWNT